jgi:predicted FMN-binding regulatory protein PaiB
LELINFLAQLYSSSQPLYVKGAKKLYSPDAFKITDENIIEEFIAKNPFTILTSEHNGKIEVTHLPINRFKDGKLYGHLAKAFKVASRICKDN